MFDIKPRSFVESLYHDGSSCAGLAWRDKLHSRTVCHCSDEAILALFRIFILCELLGEWPATIGIIFMHCSRSRTGAAGVFFLPCILRWWMRVRLDVARSWQTETRGRTAMLVQEMVQRLLHGSRPPEQNSPPFLIGSSLLTSCLTWSRLLKESRTLHGVPAGRCGAARWVMAAVLRWSWSRPNRTKYG